ncbi:hypothetical protein L218DRAFT_913739 [Marasmius fiardii PR-910]|nr:hypothetical protein L218DRAFT_913739 [Marasmius fiardii PR-910]
MTSFDLWPEPSLPPSPTSPNRFPGANHESTETLRDVLRLNHEKWHIFYDELGRHNHISHHVLAVWALGGHKDIVRMGYEKNEFLQQPRGTSPGVITEENWIEHLGKREYYAAYQDFFMGIVSKVGGPKALEDYVFSGKANFGSKNKAGRYPEMLCRIQAGIMHGHIHIGYGAEFSIPGMYIEGLAEAAVSDSENSQLIPKALFDSVDAETQSSVASRLQSVLSLGGTTSSGSSGVDAFTILARIAKDPKIVSKAMGLETMYYSLMEDCGDALYDYASQWTLDVSSPAAVQEKIEELQWAMTLMYAVPGYKQLDDGDFNADFLAAHFITSAIFLPSLVGVLTPRSQALLLRSFFATVLGWWVLIGKPPLNIPALFEDNELANPTPPQPQPAPHAHALPSSDSPTAVNPNPWTWLIQQAIVHPDDHFPKCQRALVHYAQLYGSRPKGYWSGKRKTELEGAEEMDGSLFLRAAVLTQKRIGRVFESVPPLQIYWDRKTYIPGAKFDSY